MSIEVSVIMIAHQKFHQTLLSLYALESQTFPPASLEVILVDDASTDQTYRLQRLRLPFHFKYVRCEPNVGRSKAKNIGAASASGQVLIFMDAEMLLDPDYVKQHYQLHQSRSPGEAVITGCMQHYNVFTVLDSRFNPEQLTQFKQLYLKAHTKRSTAKALRKRAARSRAKARPLSRQARYVRLLRRLKQTRRGKDSIIRLFSKASIVAGRYQKYAFHTPFYPEVIKRFGSRYEGFHLPYIFVVTHNISLQRSTFDRVGPFNEGFQGWGCEDWEFGYRLYRSGVQILDHPLVKVYHQEHPRSLGSQTKDGLINYRFFFSLHPEFDVGVQSLCWIGKDIFEVNDMVHEYKLMAVKEQYPVLSQACLGLFDQIFHLLIHDLPMTGLLDAAEMGREPGWRARFYEEWSLFKASGGCPKLAASLEWLLSL
ncbi:glycosyltransferase family 2 protein [Paenibacillus algicola]|nr:glycosyltransferase family 2 protein [Paenibacillus algicola]